jgi:hypothetical protein
VLRELPVPDEEGEAIIRHIAQAESWYFSNIGHARLPLEDDPHAALAAVRSRTFLWLHDLEGSTAQNVVMQEQWTARKVLRRTLWHERDHTQQLQRLVWSRRP